MELRQGRRSVKGFTLVELLVVIAITGILLALLIGPLVQGFNLTRRGQAQIEAQNTARLVLDQIEREIKRAAYVFDNSNRWLNIWVPDGADADNAPDLYRIRFGIIDFVLPAQGNPAAESNDPTSPLSRGDLNFPFAPGRAVVRYFIGLQDNRSTQGVPDNPYRNGFEIPLIEAGKPDNLYVLYRAEFSPYVFNRQTRTWRVNPDLFEDQNNDNIPDDFTDPNFFYGPHAANWKKIAQPIGAIGRIDMISAQYDPATGNITGVTPLVQFRPTLVTGQTGSPVETETLGDEMGTIIPRQMRLPHGSWANSFRLTIYRSRPDALSQGLPLRYYYTAINPNDGHLWLYFFRLDQSGSTLSPPPTAICDLTQFKLNQMNGTPILPILLDSGNPNWEPLALHLDEQSGILDFAIPSWMQLPGQPPAVFSTGNYAVYTDNSDVENFNPRTINGRFNRDLVDAYSDPVDQYNVHNIRRYVSLIDLDRDGAIDPPNINPLTWSTASIVPGSEVVIAPDQTPGPNWGRPIRYSRVANAAQSPGPNQYRINYVDISTNPTAPLGLKRGYIEFYSDPLSPLPPGEDNVKISFFYQLNRPSDTVVVDYETRRIMTFSLSIKLFDLASGAPNFYTLNTRLELPNLIELRGSSQ